MNYDKDQPFEERIKVNYAEKKFEEYCKKRDIQFYKYGVDDHPFGKKFYKVKRIIRNTPDYIILNTKTEESFLVEVKGCKEKVGIKLNDMKSYDFWRELSKIYYGVYSCTFKEFKVISHEKLKTLVKGCNIKQYPDFNDHDTKLYYEIPFGDL